jgi:putative redox protein
VAERLEVSATWAGGFRAQVAARGHEIVIDEPASSGGSDAGMMPTEALCASIASCFCLALAFAAGKRGRELPGLRVVVRTERVGRELRYGGFDVEAQAAVPGEEMEALMEQARRWCWVSNTLAPGVHLSYRFTSVDVHSPR